MVMLIRIAAIADRQQLTARSQVDLSFRIPATCW